MTVRPPFPTASSRPGVSVGGVAVGGMTAAQAAPWISQSVLGTITVKLGDQQWTASASQLGLHAYIDRPLQGQRSQRAAPRPSCPARTSRS